MDCPICYEEILGNDEYVTTRCNHKFHANCFQQYWAYNAKNAQKALIECPICRCVLIEMVSMDAVADGVPPPLPFSVLVTESLVICLLILICLFVAAMVVLFLT